MNIKSKLKVWNKKTISKEDLELLTHVNSDNELFELISDAVNQGILSPVKASGNNGNRKYPIWLKYRINLYNDNSKALSEITLLHPLINKTGYLQSKPSLYLKYKSQIEKLNKYLFKNHSLVPISKKERSFEIFDEEKQLDDKAFYNLLNRLELTPEVLCYYETPEYCFNDYIPEKKEEMTLLICENKDIWFNIRRRMYEDSANSIFGIHIDGVVYGCGNKVSKKNALSEYTNFMKADKIDYLYWGDIDRAGLNIYISLIKNNPNINIQLFVPAYEKMMLLAKKRNIPNSEDHREHIAEYEPIYQQFSEESKKLLNEYIKNNKRVPQEIINYEILCNNMEG